MIGLLIVSVIAAIAILAVFAPFFLGQGGTLASASANDAPEDLMATKDALVQRFLKDEAAFNKKEISAREWKARQAYLLHRYMDAARRLDFLRQIADVRRGV